MTSSVHEQAAAPVAPQGDKALIYQGELEIMARFVRDYPDIETGGDLFGFWTHTGSPVVEYVLGPGHQANHEGAEFHQEAIFLRSCGAMLRDLHGLQHVGTWHSHHRLGLTEPSNGDSTTMQKAVENNQFSGWMLTICNFRDQTDLVELRSYMYRPGQEGAHSQLTWIVLPGASPVRTAMKSVTDFHGIEPVTPHCAYEPIPSTTFVAMSTPQTVTANPSFPPTSFLATPEGRAELFRLYQELSQTEQGVDILQREDGRVGLAFQREGYAFEIVFPHSYPVVKPVVEYHPVDIPDGQEESWTNPRTLFVSMDRGDDAVAVVEGLIKGFLAGHGHQADDPTGQGEDR
ncbi:MAG: hypothetical protein ACYDHF_01465 [Candidatus Cryosericum sp.]